jgi:hypothetical protein
MIQKTFYKELEQVFHHFRKYYMNIPLEDFNAEVGRQYFLINNLEPTSG